MQPCLYQRSQIRIPLMRSSIRIRIRIRIKWKGWIHIQIRIKVMRPTTPPRSFIFFFAIRTVRGPSSPEKSKNDTYLKRYAYGTGTCHTLNSNAASILASAIRRIQKYGIWCTNCTINTPHVESLVKVGWVVLPLPRRVPCQSRAGCRSCPQSRSGWTWTLK